MAGHSPFMAGHGPFMAGHGPFMAGHGPFIAGPGPAPLWKVMIPIFPKRRGGAGPCLARHYRMHGNEISSIIRISGIPKKGILVR
eukprot:gene17580-biopygen23360